MYTSVPRAHHRTAANWRGLSLRDEDAPSTPVARVSGAGTGLTNVAIEEGQGFGTLGVCQYDAGAFDS